MADVLAFSCPRCGAPDITLSYYGPCESCREILKRIYIDRNRVRIAALAHLRTEDFNVWLISPCDGLGGDTPWDFIDLGFTDQVIDAVKALKRLPADA